jgi:hypothetical protein
MHHPTIEMVLYIKPPDAEKDTEHFDGTTTEMI